MPLLWRLWASSALLRGQGKPRRAVTQKTPAETRSFFPGPEKTPPPPGSPRACRRDLAWCPGHLFFFSLYFGCWRLLVWFAHVCSARFMESRNYAVYLRRRSLQLREESPLRLSTARAFAEPRCVLALSAKGRGRSEESSLKAHIQGVGAERESQHPGALL